MLDYVDFLEIVSFFFSFFFKVGRRNLIPLSLVCNQYFYSWFFFFIWPVNLSVVHCKIFIRLSFVLYCITNLISSPLLLRAIYYLFC